MANKPLPYNLTGDPEEKITVQMPLMVSPRLRKKIVALAREEERSISGMTRVLINLGLEHYQVKEIPQ